MGNGRLDIGQGIGEASVWNPAIPVQNFNAILQQKKLKDQSDADSIAAELSKVKSDGLRNDADRQLFLKKYEDIKNNAIAGAGERNFMKRALLKADTRDKLMGLQQFVEKSKAQGQQEQAFGKQYMSNPTPWSDDAINNYRKSIAAPLDSPDVIKDFTTQQRVVDHSKVDEALKKMHNDALTKVPWSNPIQDGGVISQGDKKGVITYQKRALPPEQILANDAHMYDVDRNVQHSIDQRYATIQGENPAETKMLRIRQAAIDRGDIAVGPNNEITSKVAGEQGRKFNPNYKPNNWKEIALWRLAHKNDGNNYAPGTPQNMNIPYNGGAKGEVVSSLGYVPINSAALNLAGSPSYNLTSGTLEPQALSSGDHQLVGIGNFPIIKSDYTSGKKKLKGTVAQPAFVKAHPNDIEYKPFLHVQTKDLAGGTEDHLVPSDRLPKNLPKATQVALKGFRAISGSGGQTASGTPLDNKHKKAATDYGL